MLEPPISNLGVKGIRKAVQATLKWPDTMDAQKLQQACFNIWIFIDYTGGTGGGIFSYMYGRFIEEARELVGDKRLSEYGRRFQQIGDLWQEVAAYFKEAYTLSNPASLLPKATKPLFHIADLEEETWMGLRRIVSG